MLTGVVSDDGIPTIELAIGGQNWRTVVDTGFNGCLELPDSLRATLNPQYRSDVVSMLAAGQIVVEKSFEVLFPFDGEFVRAVATFAPGSEILLGTAMLRNHRLDINFKEQTVLIERAA